MTEWLWLVQFSVVRESSRVQMMLTVSVGIASCIVAVYARNLGSCEVHWLLVKARFKSELMWFW